MDAANLLIKRTALSLAFTLLIPAAAFAQPVFVAPTSVTIVGNYGTLAVSSTGGAITSFSATITYPNVADQNWLCINPLNGFGSNESVAGASTPETFTLNVCGTPSISVTTHTATVTLHATDGSGALDVPVPVSYTSGQGVGGAITASPSSITSPAYLTSYSASVTLLTSSVSPISFSLAVSPSVGWVTNLVASANTVSNLNAATVTFTLNGSGLAAGTLNTTLVVTTNTQETLSIPITFYNGVAGACCSSATGSLSVSPSTIAWSYSTTNPGQFPASTTMSLTSTNGAITYTATTSQTGWVLVNGGFYAQGIVGSNPLIIGPSQNLDALAPGSYTQTVAITGSDGSSAAITVAATVNGTGSGLVTITPSPISLSASVNGSPESTVVTVTSAVGGTMTAAVTGSGISCSICNSSVSVTAGVATTITITGSPSGLTNGTYPGTLNVTVAGNTSGAQINFVVGTGATGGTTTAASPSQLNYYYEQNTNESISQSQSVYLSGTGNYTVTTSTANGSGNWLTVSPSSGALPATISIVASASGLASSTYTGTVTIANTSTSTTSAVNVSLLVQGITTIYASPGDYVFSANQSSLTQFAPIAVVTSDNTQVSVAAAVTNPSATPWLTVSGNGNTPLDLDVVTNATGLANGTYVGSIAVTGGNNTATVPIVLVVTGSSVSTGSGVLTLGASALTLQASVGGAPASATLSVGPTTTTTFTVSSQVTTGSTTWLSVSPFGTTTTPTTLTVTANPAGLTAGNYSGAISLVANGVTQTVPVTFVVGATTTGTAVTVTANGGTATSPTLTFTASSPGASVTPQYITVSSTSGESSAVFTAAATVTSPSGGSWLSLTTTAGQQYPTPLTINVSANTTGLAAGTYNGTITITPTGGTAVSVPVTLTVQGAVTVGVSTNALSFTYTAGAATPSTQTVGVTVASATSATFTAAASVTTPSGGSWLSITPASGTAPSNITVSIVPTGLAAGTYSGTITVAGSSPATGTATVTVSLTVTVPAPTITAVVNAASFSSGPIAPGEIITIGGSSIGPATAASFTVSTNSSTGIQSVPTTALAGVTVTVSGYPAPILYVSANQINAIVPYEVAGILNPTVQVTFLGQASNSYSATGAATAPGIFTSNGSGTGPGAILNANYSSNTATGSLPGTVVQVFMTGEGQTNPAGVDGKVTGTGGPYPAPLLPITITVGGLPANYEFAGEAPGLVSGVLQLNVIIPPSLSITGNVPLVVSIGSASSQGGLTVNIL